MIMTAEPADIIIKEICTNVSPFPDVALVVLLCPSGNLSTAPSVPGTL